ncbi:di-heme enzyme [Leptospira langatensis]|uniref:Di-heme enzyme n=1 Tax=Leptospira langatensis TaxID=2484983 RepID=A0A5F1ZWJ1_9LEPT|nr:methanobactin export MATE transporter MbnM [Leptospira langatensis]TGJ98252.1 di-heme enzyme [Leptospira langatensis]TGL43166.1 di-heme enzyme [Leptospira langatensis]
MKVIISITIVLFSIIDCAPFGLAKDKGEDLQTGLLLLGGNVPEGTPYIWDLPSGFPDPKIPENNPMTVEKVTLGRFLFYDTKLSENQTQACASCHQQDKAFTDGRTVSAGSTGQAHPRNAQHLSNVVYNLRLTWANPLLKNLEDQARVPMFGDNPVELGMKDKEDLLLSRLENDPIYPPLFRAAFPNDPNPFSLLNITKALSSFQRSLVSGNSAYDRFQAGDISALSASAIRGKNLFFGERGECFHCHGGFNFTDTILHTGTVFEEVTFHNNGLDSSSFISPNGGLYEFTFSESDRGKFRAPSLRNVELTAPYMHDGSLPDLISVIDHYANGGSGDGVSNPNRDPFVRSFSLTPSEKQDLVEFLKSLTDEDFVTNPKFESPF